MQVYYLKINKNKIPFWVYHWSGGMSEVTQSRSVSWIMAITPRRNAVTAQRHMHLEVHKFNFIKVYVYNFVRLTQRRPRKNFYWLPILLVFVHKRNFCHEWRCGPILPPGFMEHVILSCCHALPSLLSNNCLTIII